jgi:hypothetical protein
MIEPKVLKNAFTWTPTHSRQGRLGHSRKADDRKPLLWLTRDGQELYLVNDSGEILESVRASSGGYGTADDQGIPVGSANGYVYEQVQPGEAVKVDEFDMIFDSDFVLAVYVEIRSAKLGHLELASPAEKGGVKKAVLLWDGDRPETS